MIQDRQPSEIFLQERASALSKMSLMCSIVASNVAASTCITHTKKKSRRVVITRNLRC